MKGNPSTNMAGLVVLCTENYFQLYHGTKYSLGKKNSSVNRKTRRTIFDYTITNPIIPPVEFQCSLTQPCIHIKSSTNPFSHFFVVCHFFPPLLILQHHSTMESDSLKGIGRMKSLPLIKGRRVDTRKYGYSRNDRAKHCPTKDRPETR